MSDIRLFVILDDLIDRWCERRVLGLLATLLPVYPMTKARPLGSGLTDNLQNLYQALRLIRSTAGNGLPQEEADRLSEAIVIVGQALYPEEYR